MGNPDVTPQASSRPRFTKCSAEWLRLPAAELATILALQAAQWEARAEAVTAAQVAGVLGRADRTSGRRVGQVLKHLVELEWATSSRATSRAPIRYRLAPGALVGGWWRIPLTWLTLSASALRILLAGVCARSPFRWSAVRRIDVSQREIAAAAGCSLDTVQRAFQAAAGAGLLVRSGRSYSVSDGAQAATWGTVVADHKSRKSVRTNLQEHAAKSRTSVRTKSRRNVQPTLARVRCPSGTLSSRVQTDNSRHVQTAPAPAATGRGPVVVVTLESGNSQTSKLPVGGWPAWVPEALRGQAERIGFDLRVAAREEVVQEDQERALAWLCEAVERARAGRVENPAAWWRSAVRSGNAPPNQAVRELHRLTRPPEPPRPLLTCQDCGAPERTSLPLYVWGEDGAELCHSCYRRRLLAEDARAPALGPTRWPLRLVREGEAA